MTFAKDVNPLVYASDETSPSSVAAHRIPGEIAAGGELVYRFWPVALAYLRLTTTSRIFTAPLTLPAALANLEVLMALPNLRTVRRKTRSWTGSSGRRTAWSSAATLSRTRIWLH